MTHTDDDIKAAEKRGYSRGYQARELRMKREALEAKDRRERERERRVENAFRDRAFLAALASLINAHGWTTGGKPINSIESRTRLAWNVAKEALKQRRGLI